MTKFLGTFAVGDTINTARLAPASESGEDWGTAMGTGWTAVLEVHKDGVAAVFQTIACSWETVDEFAVLVALGGEALLAPTSPAVAANYDAYLKLTKLSNTYIGGPEGDVRTPFTFTIVDTAP